MKRNKILVLFVCMMLVMAFTFAGCGSQDGTTPDADSGQGQTEPAYDGPYTIENIREHVVGVDEPVELMA